MQKNGLADLLTCAFTATIVMSMSPAAQTIKAGSGASGLALGKKIVERGCGNKNRVLLEAAEGAGFFFAPPA